jgi:hypothetical protein
MFLKKLIIFDANKLKIAAKSAHTCNESNETK